MTTNLNYQHSTVIQPALGGCHNSRPTAMQCRRLWVLRKRLTSTRSFRDDFSGQVTQPTVSKHWRKSAVIEPSQQLVPATQYMTAGIWMTFQTGVLPTAESRATAATISNCISLSNMSLCLSVSASCLQSPPTQVPHAVVAGFTRGFTGVQGPPRGYCTHPAHYCTLKPWSATEFYFNPTSHCTQLTVTDSPTDTLCLLTTQLNSVCVTAH